MTLEVALVIGSSSVLSAILPILLKHWLNKAKNVAPETEKQEDNKIDSTNQPVERGQNS